MNRQDVLERKVARLKEIIIKLIMSTKAGSITIHWSQLLKLFRLEFAKNHKPSGVLQRKS